VEFCSSTCKVRKWRYSGLPASLSILRASRAWQLLLLLLLLLLHPFMSSSDTVSCTYGIAAQEGCCASHVLCLAQHLSQLSQSNSARTKPATRQMLVKLMVLQLNDQSLGPTLEAIAALLQVDGGMTERIAQQWLESGIVEALSTFLGATRIRRTAMKRLLPPDLGMSRTSMRPGHRLFQTLLPSVRLMPLNPP
jgi:hypothetical protein